MRRILGAAWREGLQWPHRRRRIGKGPSVFLSRPSLVHPRRHQPRTVSSARSGPTEKHPISGTSRANCCDRGGISTPDSAATTQGKRRLQRDPNSILLLLLRVDDSAAIGSVGRRLPTCRAEAAGLGKARDPASAGPGPRTDPRLDAAAVHEQLIESRATRSSVGAARHAAGLKGLRHAQSRFFELRSVEGVALMNVGIVCYGSVRGSSCPSRPETGRGPQRARSHHIATC